MDSSLTSAALALARGEALQALQLVALRKDAHGLALRATALSQLGDYVAAKELFKRAAKAFDAREELARARCAVALAELALATRELGDADKDLAWACDVLARRGDSANARYAQLIHARLALALGQLEAAEQRLARIDDAGVPPAVRTLLELARAELALRRVRPDEAKRALTRAGQAALRAQVASLFAEVESAKRALVRPVARLIQGEANRPLSIFELAALLTGSQLVVDACRRCAQRGETRVRFETRPVLFALLRRLAEAYPLPVSRQELILVGFGIRRPSDSLRARLRVAMGRLRTLLAELAELHATADGFALQPRTQQLYVLGPTHEDDASGVLALLAEGDAWSSSALALALGASQRRVQRALTQLAANGKVASFGRGKNRRWLAAPIHAFATHMLLPGSSPAQ